MAKLDNVNVDRIKKLAQEMGMTMKYLAGCIGKHPGYLSCVRNGTDRISEEDLAVIADRLSTTVGYLTGQTDDPAMPQMDDPKRIAQLMEIVRKLNTHQMDELIAIADIIEGEIMYGFPDEYTGLTGDKCELIGQIKSSSNKEVLILRAFCMLSGSFEQSKEMIEICDIYRRLMRSGKRQLVGKAYELFEGSCEPQIEDSIYTPKGFEWFIDWLDARIKEQ